jgi:hypothetical protein
VNSVPLTAARPLLDLLGARWRAGVPAAAVAWDMTTGLAGFALSDGTLAVAHPVWEGAPVVRRRDGGGAELIPGTAPAPPAARVKAHHGACLSIAADPETGFLTGGARGRVTCVRADDACAPLPNLTHPWHWSRLDLAISGPVPSAAPCTAWEARHRGSMSPTRSRHSRSTPRAPGSRSAMKVASRFGPEATCHGSWQRQEATPACAGARIGGSSSASRQTARCTPGGCQRRHRSRSRPGCR